MSSDGEQIRAAARAVSGLGSRARGAGVAVTGAGHVRWESVGAQRFRERLGTLQREFQRCARELDDLSRTMLGHATQVEANELALLKAVLALEMSVLDKSDDVVKFADDVKDTAVSTASGALRTGKKLLDTANPLRAIGAMR